MKKMLLNFADALLSKEQMKVVRGGEYGEGGQDGSGGGVYCVRFDTSNGCGTATVNFTGTQSQAVAYGDHQVGTSGNYGYNITSGRC